MPHSLVIVESPAKARTIAGYLGDDYTVESSIGHIRDLPSRASEIPKAYSSEPWARLGVDVNSDFKPLYVVPDRAKEQVSYLKSILADDNIKTLYLATDEDREGEAIAWHLMEVLSPQVPVHRMVFHEITAQAIAKAIESPRELDRYLVDAQEARRIFDRLYGYEVSPVLWRKVKPKLSAGRVQSVANRLIVERERERMAFNSASYWSLMVGLSEDAASAATGPFETRLISLDGQRVAMSSDFDDSGRLVESSGHDVVVLDDALAGELAGAVVGRTFTVSSRESRSYKRRPAPPFITSTLQQSAGSRYGFSSSRTMAAAQRLYEAGAITYMRTDSTTLSSQAQSTARATASTLYGPDTLPDKPRAFTRKSKNAQEAHEAIRPAGVRWSAPGSIKKLGDDATRVYDLIWQRTVASQMNDVVGETATIRLIGSVPTADGDREAELHTSGTVITAPGWRQVYGVGREDAAADGAVASSENAATTDGAAATSDGTADAPEQSLPNLVKGDTAQAKSADPKGHETLPPARYTEASMVRRMEELGVGRPSTYASIMETIQNRGYVWKKGSALVPSWTAFVTVSLMEQHYDHLVDYELTARMEDDLDRIAAGEKEFVPWLSDFYFSADNPTVGLRHMVSDEFLESIDAAALNNIAIGEDSDGKSIVVRVGRYGPYIRRGEDTRPLPDELPPDELTIERATRLLSEPTELVLGIHPHSGEDVIALAGRFGPYVSQGRRTDDGPKPKTASLLKTMSLESLTLDEALSLLSLPRTVGNDADDVPITVQNGRYGPYLTRDKDSRSLDSEEQLFSLTLPEALELLAQPKRYRNQRTAEPLRQIGTDPTSGQPVVLKDGRFGLYVTDGAVNASLRKGDEGESITIERAADLLQMRRDRVATGASTRRKKPAAKKKPAAGKKKPAAKKKPAVGKVPTAAKKKPAVGKVPAAAKKVPTAAKNPAAVDKPTSDYQPS